MMFLLHNVKQLHKGVIGSRTKKADVTVNQQDIDVLAYMSATMFYTVAKNGIGYWYYFVSTERNIDTAKYIMELNGVYPLMHLSEFYCRDKIVLRVPQFIINRDKNAKTLIDGLMNTKHEHIDKKKTCQYLDLRRGQIYQNTK